jgi:DmsE family decaheme c-type cytochrome
MHFLDHHKLAAIAVAMSVLLLLVVAGALTLPAEASPPDRATKDTKAAPVKATQDPSQYIGSDNCKTCHEDLPSKGFYSKFEATPHWKTMLEKRRGPDYVGCEACHGPGAEHMAAGGDKSKITVFSKDVPAKKVSQTCLKCHTYGEEHSNYARSAHNVNNVSCIDCHSVHKAKVNDGLLVKAQPQLCYTCHLDTKPDFSRPFRHRVNEGLLKCTDCHNQHGGFLTKGLRATAAQDAVCFKCHADKAGPFVYEHAPVKTEGCVACHIPHGSSNPRLLRRAHMNLLCLECHTLNAGVAPVGPSHDQSQKYQACTVCHVTIHGSNQSSVFFR